LSGVAALIFTFNFLPERIFVLGPFFFHCKLFRKTISECDLALLQLHHWCAISLQMSSRLFPNDAFFDPTKRQLPGATGRGIASCSLNVDERKTVF